MPSAVPELYQYSHVPETQEELDWADLANLDLSKYGSKEGNQELAQTLIEAIRTKGFFYVTNFGISQEDVDRQFALGQAFYELPLEEKLKYEPDLDNGVYNGYRPAGRRILGGGVRDKTEVWNMATNDGHITQPIPELLENHKEEIENFARDLNKKVLDPLNHLIALALELPEDYLTNVHRWNVHDESHLRYMKYSKFSPEEIKQLGDGLWSHGHTDLGTITLLFRQPVAALQIKDHETGNWKWAKPLNASLTVNTCDALNFLTGGYVKSTIHRVSVPPKDQQHVDRLGLLYFARPQNDLKLSTIDSPVLKRHGFTQNEFERGGHDVPTMGGWYHDHGRYVYSLGIRTDADKGGDLRRGVGGGGIRGSDPEAGSAVGGGVVGGMSVSAAASAVSSAAAGLWTEGVNNYQPLVSSLSSFTTSVHDYVFSYGWRQQQQRTRQRQKLQRLHEQQREQLQQYHRQQTGLAAPGAPEKVSSGGIYCPPQQPSPQQQRFAHPLSLQNSPFPSKLGSSATRTAPTRIHTEKQSFLDSRGKSTLEQSLGESGDALLLAGSGPSCSVI